MTVSSRSDAQRHVDEMRILASDDDFQDPFGAKRAINRPFGAARHRRANPE